MSVIDLHQHRKEKARPFGETAGLGGMGNKQQSQSNKTGETDQRVDDPFDRLQYGFKRRGWSLYRLLDGASLACNSQRGLQMPCPDNRAAAALVRMLGGAA